MPIQSDPEGVEPRNLRDLAPLAGRHVLEIGCCDGRLTWRYADLAGRVTGFDLDPARLPAALAARPPDLRDRVNFARANVVALPFGRGSFDLAIFAWSF